MSTRTQAVEHIEPTLVIASKLAEAVVVGRDYTNLPSLAAAVHQRAHLPEVAALVDMLPHPHGRHESSAPAGEVSAEYITRQLKQLSKTEGALEKFAFAFAERVFISGGVHLGKMSPQIEEVLKKCSRALMAAQEMPAGECAPDGTKKAVLLRNIGRELIELIKPAGAVTAQGYLVLNQQHRIIASAKRSEDKAVFDASSKPLRECLLTTGVTLMKTAKGVADSAPKQIAKLIEAGIVDKFDIQSVGATLVYAGGAVTTAGFESIVPPKLREKIGDALWEEFHTRYSGALRPIGIHTNREDGIPTLADRKRVSAVAEKVGVPPSLVVLALKYFENQGLVYTKHANYGFELSDLAKKVGLGIRAVHFVERSRHSQTDSEAVPSLDKFCTTSTQVRDGWKLPGYSVHTKDGGAPWVHLLDEMLFPNARIDASVIRSVSAHIKANPGMIIASNMMQGDPAVFPRDQRTTVQSQVNGVPLSKFSNQLNFTKRMLESFNQPALLLFGKRELETANLMADIQRVRDQLAQKGGEKPAEGTVGKALGKLNDIELNAGRKYAARLQAENLLFIANVVMPLEFKLGREVMSSDEVHSKIGLRLNEIEILREVVDALATDTANGTDSETRRCKDLYADFFALPEVGPQYLSYLEQVVFPRVEELRPGAPVGRGGATIQLKTAKGEDGLSIIALPEFKAGIGELRDPGKLISMLKSRAVAGRAVADIVVCGSVGAPFFSMLATGQAIVAPGSLQASNFDDIYTFTESVDGHKRRRTSMGEERQAGFISFKGGVDKGVKTGAYHLQLTSAKIEEVLASNRAAHKPECAVDIFQTNDLQLGSPTSCPAPFVRGLMWAVSRGVKDIVLDGDLIQGQNYGRFYAEAQMTGIIGIEDQQAYLSDLFEPVLDYIVRCRREDPSFELPKFRIIVGNHEMNSQAGKGAQGNWYMQPLYNQIYHSYRAAFGASEAEGKVVYPRKYISHDGTNVDYPIDILDYTEKTGFRIGAQHYSGAGAKGSGCIPPIVQARGWNRSKENENRDVHGWLWAHYHTQSIMMADGVFHAIFGANATGSGFEHHLGYPLTVPAAGMIRLSSTKPPELQIVTEPFLHLQEQELQKIAEYKALVAKHGSLEGWVEAKRAQHQLRNTGNTVNMQALKGTAERHGFVELTRKIGPAS